MGDACDAAEEYLEAQQKLGRVPADVDFSEPWGYLTGGLDLDMAPRLLESKPTQAEETALLERARQAELPNSNLGRKDWKSSKTLGGPPPPPPPPIEPPRIGGFAE